MGAQNERLPKFEEVGEPERTDEQLAVRVPAGTRGGATAMGRIRVGRRVRPCYPKVGQAVQGS
jgi:hypothetical protein